MDDAPATSAREPRAVMSAALSGGFSSRGSMVASADGRTLRMTRSPASACSCKDDVDMIWKCADEQVRSVRDGAMNELCMNSGTCWEMTRTIIIREVCGCHLLRPIA